MKPVVFDPDAEDEVDSALARSEAMSRAVAVEFRQAIDAALADIVANPTAAAAVVSRPQYRRKVLARFPYSIVYSNSPSVIRVVAFIHHRRGPGYWKKRLRPN